MKITGTAESELGIVGQDQNREALPSFVSPRTLGGIQDERLLKLKAKDAVDDEEPNFAASFKKESIRCTSYLPEPCTEMKTGMTLTKSRNFSDEFIHDVHLEEIDPYVNRTNAFFGNSRDRRSIMMDITKSELYACKVPGCATVFQTSTLRFQHTVQLHVAQPYMSDAPG